MDVQLNHSYTCVFRGARDHYEAAAALAEAGKLDTLVTDFYTPDAVMRAADRAQGRSQEFWARRHSALLPSSRVTRMPLMALPLGRPWSRTDRVAARMGARAAAACRDAALVYSYHWPGFLAADHRAPGGPRVVFQVHPVAQQVRQVLRADRERSGIEEALEAEERRGPDELEAEAANLRQANGFITASSFVRSGLVALGVSAENIEVAPYGADRLGRPQGPRARPGRRPGPLRLLWVGQLSYRKGPHWLFEALRSLRPGLAELTLVTRSELPAWLGPMPAGTRLVRNPSDGELARLYVESDLFTLPSLVEGFGLVYLEALNAGLPVLGTGNTGLPDVAVEGDNALLVQPGSVGNLVSTIEAVATDPALLAHLQEEAGRQALPSWSSFRSNVRSGLATLESRVRA